MSIEAPTVQIFFNDIMWTTTDFATLVEDWAGTGNPIPNRVWNIAAYDVDDNQVLYEQHVTQNLIAPDPSWYRVEITAVEVTSVGGAPPDDPILEFGEEATTSFALQAPPVEHPDGVGGYVRHRNRMVSQSVFEDIADVLIACRWMAGTTLHEVDDPYNTGTWGIVTTTEDQVLPLVEGNPINLIDAFPESKGRNVAGEPETGKTPPNTLAVDSPVPGEAQDRELGSISQLIPYTFMLAFFGTSDAVGQAVLSDLADRFAGRLCRNAVIALWDYTQDDPALVVYMDVEAFSYKANSGEMATPSDVYLWFANLDLIDDVD